jgi:mercuric ion transport protein
MVAPTLDGREGAAVNPVASRALVVLAWLFVACLVVQFFLVGLEIFEALGESELHRDFAYTYGWLTPIMVLLAAVANASRRARILAVTLLVLFALQTYLPLLAERAPMVAAVHPVTALLVVLVAVLFARALPWNPADAGTDGP